MSQQPQHYTAQPINSPPPRPQNVTVNVVGGKSLLLAYVLWFFLGGLGIHKFYLAQPFQGVIYLILSGLGWLTAAIVIGWLFLGVWALLMFIDIFTMPIRVGVLNGRLARRVNGY